MRDAPNESEERERITLRDAPNERVRPQWQPGLSSRGGVCGGRWSPHGVEGWADSVRGGVKQSGRPWSTKVPAKAGGDPSVIGSGKDLMARSLTRRVIAGTAPCLLPPGLTSPALNYDDTSSNVFPSGWPQSRK